MTTKLEVRSIAGELELRAAPEGSDSPGTLCGYAAVFNSLSEDLGGFRERILPGAFAGVIGSDIRCLRNHEPEALLGRTSNGTLRLAEDARGLRYEVDLPNTTQGRDTAEMVRRGDMSGCSFSFTTRDDSWDFSGAVPTRSIRSFDQVADVGPVTFPAYRDTACALRSLDAARPAPAVPLPLLKAKIRLASAF